MGWVGEDRWLDSSILAWDACQPALCREDSETARSKGGGGRLRVVMKLSQTGSPSWEMSVSLACMKVEEAHLSTMEIEFARTAPSSFSRCGLFPVFSNCRITPTTMVSSIPSVSTFVCPDSPPGDGGGVFSAIRPALFGRSSRKRMVVVRGGLAGVGEVELEVCDRLIFFEGGCCCCCSPGTVAGGER